MYDFFAHTGVAFGRFAHIIWLLFTMEQTILKCISTCLQIKMYTLDDATTHVFRSYYLGIACATVIVTVPT